MIYCIVCRVCESMGPALKNNLKTEGMALNEKIEYSINLLRKAEQMAMEYSDKGFFLAFSGGKDSQALYHVAK